MDAGAESAPATATLPPHGRRPLTLGGIRTKRREDGDDLTGFDCRPSGPPSPNVGSRSVCRLKVAAFLHLDYPGARRAIRVVRWRRE
ncbi:hypothetical protein HET69_37750 [Streptomyces sp. CJ_13]|uniref:hypothetical protein n=1 Tax=Streptomyces sp. CJ_13 TaxID=2724943 RepID=UPI001BDCDEA4|nr:hypothetical protein [Streptomyces sp. CJ_13]MBT1189576.1 hypothetical protein [Streptomyces sp. CJ_13]